jgi:hypothetical protein
LAIRPASGRLPCYREELAQLAAQHRAAVVAKADPARLATWSCPARAAPSDSAPRSSTSPTSTPKNVNPRGTNWCPHNLPAVRLAMTMEHAEKLWAVLTRNVGERC